MGYYQGGRGAQQAALYFARKRRNTGVAGTPPPDAAPVVLRAPYIPAALKVGVAAQCNVGSWYGYPTGTFTYKWVKVGTGDIPGATGFTYTPVAGDAGAELYCIVTCTNPSGAPFEASNIAPVSA